jgi:hypothetical protein
MKVKTAVCPLCKKVNIISLDQPTTTLDICEHYYHNYPAKIWRKDLSEVIVFAIGIPVDLKEGEVKLKN